MKRLFAILFLVLFTALQLGAATITGTIQNSLGATNTVRVYFYPLTAPRRTGDPFIITGQPVSVVATNGQLSAPLVEGLYQVRIGESGYDKLKISVPAGTNSYDIGSITSDGIVYIPAGSGSGGGEGTAYTTSSQLATDITDETGSGALVFATSPSLSTPTLTTPIIADFTSATHSHQTASGGGSLSASAISSGTFSLARGGTGVALSDPNANGFWGWDDTDGAIAWMYGGTGLSYDHATHTWSVTAAGVGDVTAANSLTNLAPLLGGGNKTIYATNAAGFRAAVGLTIGSDVQANDTELGALAGTVSAANKLPYYTGSGSATTADLTSFARTLLDDADAAAALSTLGATNIGYADQFGAIPGDSTDDYAAITNCLGVYGVCYLKPGTYITSKAIAMPSGSALIGAGKHRSTLQLQSGSTDYKTQVAGGKYGVIYTTANNCRVEGLTIDANMANQINNGGANTSTNSIAAIELRGTNNIIRGVKAIGWGMGNYAAGSTEVFPLYTSVTSWASAGDNEISGCEVTGPYYSYSANKVTAICISAPSTDGVGAGRVTGNWVHDITPGSASKFSAISGLTAYGANLEISGNLVRNVYGAAVYSDSWTNINVRISGNTLLDVAGGVVVNGATNGNWVITGNAIRNQSNTNGMYFDNMTYWYAQYGIRFWNSTTTNASISGNWIECNDGNGLTVQPVAFNFSATSRYANIVAANNTIAGTTGNKARFQSASYWDASKLKWVQNVDGTGKALSLDIWNDGGSAISSYASSAGALMGWTVAADGTLTATNGPTITPGYVLTTPTLRFAGAPALFDWSLSAASNITAGLDFVSGTTNVIAHLATKANAANPTFTGLMALSGLTGLSTNLYNFHQNVKVDASGNVTANSFTSTGAGGTGLDSVQVTNKLTNSILEASKLVTTTNDKSLASVTVSSGLSLSGGNLSVATVLDRMNNIGAGTSGDIIYRDSTGWTNLAKSTDNKVLKLISGLPSWQTDETAAGGETSGTVHSGGSLTTDNRIVRADGTGGTNVQSSVVTIDDSGNATGFAGISASAITNTSLTGGQAVVTAADKSLASVAYTGAGNVMRTRTGVPREIWIPANAMTPEDANGPGAATNLWATTTDKQTVEAWDFDAAATGESVQFTLTLPLAWDASTVKAKVFWKPVNATSGDVVWGVAGGSANDNETGGNTLGTEVTVTDTVQTGTNVVHISSATGAITIGGSPAAGHMTWFRVRRLGSNGSDTMANDARLLGLHLQYTETATEASAW